VVALSGAACRGPAPPRAADPVEAAPLHRGPLTDYVAAAELEWLLVVDLPALRADPAGRQVLTTFVSAESADAYARATGLDLRKAGTVLVARYPLATVYLVETDEGATIEERFAERVEEPPEARRPHPQIQSLLGVRAGYPRMLVSVRGHFVAFAVGDPTPARIAELYARGRITRATPALRGAALRDVASVVSRAPVRFYAPGPFEGAWHRGARGLLGGATALAASAELSGEALEVRVLLFGAWDPIEDIPRAEEAWQDLAGSAFGALVGAEELARPPRVQVHGERLELVVALRIRPLLQGLRAAVAAELREILEPPGGAPAGLPDD
jgi:hypothetical protein